MSYQQSEGAFLLNRLHNQLADMRDFLNENFEDIQLTFGGIFTSLQELEDYLEKSEEAYDGLQEELLDELQFFDAKET